MMRSSWLSLEPATARTTASSGVSSALRARLSADRAAALVATSLRGRVRVGHLGGPGRPLEQVIAEARRELDRRGRVIVASYLLAPGFFASRLDASAADVVTAPLSSGVLLDDRLVDVVVRRYTDASRPPLARLG